MVTNGPEEEQRPSLSDEAERYRIISELTSDYAYSMIVDADGELELEWVSEAFIRDFGYSVEEINERNIFSLVHPEDLDTALVELQRILSGEPGVIEIRLISRAGVARWLNLYAKPMWDEYGTRVVRLYGAAVDISERKIAEEALALTEFELDEARGKLISAESERRLILGAITHELRNPLAAIIGFGKTMQGKKLPADMQANLIDRMVANAEKIDRAISELMRLEHLEDQGSIERRAINIRDLINRVVEAIGPCSQTIEVEADDATAWVDEGKVEMIVDNLLRNAVKHTPPDTNVKVTARLLSGLAIVVDDDGPGVPEAQRELIFQPLWRGAESKGAGLGLYLVARLSELHGGRCWVQEREPCGASFRVWLPQRG